MGVYGGHVSLKGRGPRRARPGAWRGGGGAGAGARATGPGAGARATQLGSRAPSLAQG